MTALRLLVALVPAAAVAVGNYAVARSLVAPAPLDCMPCLAWLVGGPLVLALILALPFSRAARPSPVERTVPAPPSDDGALRLLGILQEEGRLVDFLEEDLSAYPDEQVGAAARGIHESCRKALRARVTLEPVLPASEGETVTVAPGFDAAAVRLTGNVGGAPPFRGVLRHAGWRATTTTLPARRGQDPHVIAPAEVEIA
jgi:uncharacterized protein DUF2760